MTASPATGSAPTETSSPTRPPLFSGVIARGVLAGIVGATVLAFWFLVVDSSQGTPFRTPNFVAGSLMGRDGMQMGIGPLVLYTLIHYGAFIVVGIISSLILTQVE